MSFTRFYDDDSRIKKRLQESTDVSRYILNVPGNGPTPNYFEDPHIRLQKWGGNLHENKFDIETDLRNVNSPYVKFCNKSSSDDFKNKYILDKTIYPNQETTTHESRATHPAWELHGIKNDRWNMLFYNPQSNIFEPLQKTVSTRIIEKNNFVPKYPF